MSKNKEIEFKYRAKIGLDVYGQLVAEKNPLEYVQVSGFDHFFYNKDDPKAFQRFRDGVDKELSLKRKESLNDNFIRLEINIPLPNYVKSEDVFSFCQGSGYEYTGSVFKSCFIYKFIDYTLSYYICYSNNMKELGRFIEIEVSNSGSDMDCFSELVVLEKIWKSLKISPGDRVKESLFELYGKEGL